MSREVFVEPCSSQGYLGEKIYTINRVEKIVDMDLKIYSVIFRFIESLYEKFRYNKKLSFCYLMLSEKSNKEDINRIIDTFKSYLQKYDFKSDDVKLDDVTFNINEYLILNLELSLFMKTSKKTSILAYLKYIKKLIELKK